MIFEHIILHLSLVEGAGAGVLQHILSHMPQSISLEDCYLLSAQEWHRIFGITQHLSQKLVEGLRDKRLLEQELVHIERNNIEWTTIVSDNYPTLLKTIHLPPAILYWQGAQPVYSRAIAFVGSRAANSYGSRATQILIPELVLAHCAIISGGALGIDSISHQAALDAGGNTVAVLGSGLLKIEHNKKLFHDIVAQGGTVLSSFPLLMGVQPGHFPARNRIIAGLSHGCVVVQAAKKSGALITAQYALEQGREVFAVPGPIDDLVSMGCHNLIQQGAKLVTTASDILIEFGWLKHSEQLYDAAAQLSVVPLSGVKKRQPTYAVDSVQAKVIHLCGRPHSIDALADQLNMNLFAAQTLLFDMQLEGLLEQDFAGLWRAK